MASHGDATNAGTRRHDVVLRIRTLLLACAGALALLPVSSSSAATMPGSIIVSTRALPTSFVPAWDGHTDSTVLEYRLNRPARVLIQVFDVDAKIVATIGTGVRPAGVQLVAWDGRDARGRVQQPGSYRLRVRANELGGSAASLRANRPSVSRTVEPIVAASDVEVTVQAPPVAVTDVRLTRSAIGRSMGASRTSARFRLSTRSWVSVAIVDAAGRAVRTLATGRRPAGFNAVSWHGSGQDGTPVPDGEYELLVSASGAGRPTATTRVPLRVDRVAPMLRVRESTRARIDAARVRVPLNLTLEEAVSLQVLHGRRTVRRSLGAGVHALVVEGASLGIRPSRRTRSVRLQLRVRDAAGNETVSSVLVRVPGVPRHPAGRPPAPRPPARDPGADPDAGAPSGSYPWPVAGIVTSEFGMRNGRPHTGLDIAVPAGTPIHPVTSGTVSFVGMLGGYGNLVIVEHPGGLRTYYAHMSRFGGFAVGDAVNHVDVIGFVGCTGSCSGPHVHFETRVQDVPQDPRRFLRAG